MDDITKLNQTPEGGEQKETKKEQIIEWIQENLSDNQEEKETIYTKLAKLKIQKSELEQKTKEQREKLSIDRTTYAIKLLLEVTKPILTEEEYKIFKYKIEYKQKISWLSWEKIQEIKEWLSQEEKEILKKEIPWERLKESLMSLSKDQRLILAEYLSEQRFIYWGCGSKIGWFKRPSWCWACVEAWESFDELDLWSYLYYVWDRQYWIKEDTLSEAYQRILETWGDEIKWIIEEIVNNENTAKKLWVIIERLTKKESAYSKLYKAWYDAEEIEEKIPKSIQYLQQAMSEDKKTVKNVKIDQDSKTIAMLIDYRYYSGSWWCEYWNAIRVHRWENKNSKTFVYRDAYHAYKDDWSLRFDSIEKLEVKKDKVKIVLKNSEREYEVVFDLEYQEQNKNLLSEEEQALFMEKFEIKKSELLKLHTRDFMMTGITPFYPTIGTLTKEVPYKKAEVVDEFVDELHWEASIVIKAQIDGYPTRGIQYEWVKYKITSNWAEMVDRDCARESELKNGKEIRIKA
jgi:hypothetical protein